jgi:hypothetical protein
LGADVHFVIAAWNLQTLLTIEIEALGGYDTRETGTVRELRPRADCQGKILLAEANHYFLQGGNSIPLFTAMTTAFTRSSV